MHQYWQSSGEILEYWNVRTDLSGEMQRVFSCMHQYWQMPGEILEYRNIRTDLSGKRACAQYAKMEALFCAACLLHENSPGGWPELYFSIQKPSLALRS